MPVDTNDLDPRFHERLNAFTAALTAQGIPAHVISAYRTNAEQASLYAKYQAGTGGIAAPPGSSYHNYGLAADIIPDNPANYPRMWAIAPQYGITPLAEKDKPHFQMAGKLSELLAGHTPPVGTQVAGGPASYPAVTSNPFAPTGQPMPAVAALGAQAAPQTPPQAQQPPPQPQVDWGSLLQAATGAPPRPAPPPQSIQDPLTRLSQPSQPVGPQAPVNLLANTTGDRPMSQT
jgi:LAS superfamily LD-carboxypeptidase LdcB